MGILNILYLKLVCFVCYLKIKTFSKYNACKLSKELKDDIEI